MASKKSVKKANTLLATTDDLSLSFEDSIIPRSDHYLSRVGTVLKQWAEEDDSYTMSGFFRKYKIPRQSFYQWVARSEQLAFDYDMAMNSLAYKREMAGLKKEMDSGMIHSSMALYCPQYKWLAEWRAKLKEEASSGSGKIEIQLTQIPMTAEVTADIARKK